MAALRLRRSSNRGGTLSEKDKDSKDGSGLHLEIAEIEALRAEIERRTAAAPEGTPRWNADPEDVQKSVARLVLTLVEFIRQLLERQAIRRMEAGTLEPDEIENLGIALMKLEETLQDISRRFGLDPDELNLDLGPLGRLI